MVGGGLCRALQPRFAAEGTKFIRDVWESGSIEDFAESDRLPKLLARHDPDLVLLTLGRQRRRRDSDRLPRQEDRQDRRDDPEGGPARLRLDRPAASGGSNGRPVVEMIKAHVAPCAFFDSTDIEMQTEAGQGSPRREGGRPVGRRVLALVPRSEADAGTFDIYAGVLK